MVSRIKAELDAALKRGMALSSVYNLLHRHGWRKLAPDKRRSAERSQGATPSANHAELVGQLNHATTDHVYPPTVWAAGEVVQEHVQISAAKPQPGSSAVYMGMYASVTQRRAAVEVGPRVVVENRATVGVLACALMVSVATVMPKKRAAGSCRVQRAVVYQRRRPERSEAYQVVQQNLETWLARRSAGGLDAGAGVVWPVGWASNSGL